MTIAHAIRAFLFANATIALFTRTVSAAASLRIAARSVVAALIASVTFTPLTVRLPFASIVVLPVYTSAALVVTNETPLSSKVCVVVPVPPLNTKEPFVPLPVIAILKPSPNT